jgi:hypothetical protein
VVGTIFCISYLLLCKAHSESGYEYGKAKSTVYCISNADTGKANWATYDKNLDSWTKGYLGEKKNADLNEYPLFSKYNSGFTYATQPEKNLATPTIAFLEDRIEGNKDI